MTKISTDALKVMAEGGSDLAKLCLSQREKIKALAGEGLQEDDPKSERIIRGLQLEIDRLRAENARLRSQ